MSFLMCPFCVRALSSALATRPPERHGLGAERVRHAVAREAGNAAAGVADGDRDPIVETAIRICSDARRELEARGGLFDEKVSGTAGRSGDGIAVDARRGVVEHSPEHIKRLPRIELRGLDADCRARRSSCAASPWSP